MKSGTTQIVIRDEIVQEFINKYPEYAYRRYIPPALFREWLNIPTGHCNNCKVPVSKPKVCWCSKDCRIELHQLIDDRLKAHSVRKRDNHKCVLCGGIGYEFDHIVPVVLGGGNCSIVNLRTLCEICHSAETRKLIKQLRSKEAKQ